MLVQPGLFAMSSLEPRVIYGIVPDQRFDEDMKKKLQQKVFASNEFVAEIIDGHPAGFVYGIMIPFEHMLQGLVQTENMRQMDEFCVVNHLRTPTFRLGVSGDWQSSAIKNLSPHAAYAIMSDQRWDQDLKTKLSAEVPRSKEFITRFTEGHPERFHYGVSIPIEMLINFQSERTQDMKDMGGFCTRYQITNPSCKLVLQAEK